MLDPIMIATARIVAALLGSQKVAVEEVPTLIRNVHQSLSDPERRIPAAPRAVAEAAQQREPPSATEPAVDIGLSVYADHLICLEDGKSFKTLTRHLNEMHGMTPEQYRAKWALPENYPMTAPEYSEVRSRPSGETHRGRRRA
jgi:predicted transcriptional regulator